MTEKVEVEIECYNCYGSEGKGCMLCNGTKKTMVTKSFAKIMGYETCPGCGNVARLKFNKWVNNPSPASGISQNGVHVCDSCASIGEAYDND